MSITPQKDSESQNKGIVIVTPPLACVVSRERMPDQWVRSDRRVENPGIRKEEDELKIRFLDTDKVNKMGRKKIQQFSAPGSETTSIPLKNPEGVRGEESGGFEGQLVARGGSEGAEEEDTK